MEVKMAREVLFEAKHMHKAFGPTIALKDVDIQINRGEIRGLIGENGSGKSTIMSIAAGMQSATGGEMFYKGEKWKPKNMVSPSVRHFHDFAGSQHRATCERGAESVCRTGEFIFKMRHY